MEGVFQLGDSVYYADKKLLVYKGQKRQRLSNIRHLLLLCLLNKMNERVVTEELVKAAYDEEKKGLNNLYGHMTQLKLTVERYDQKLRIENTRGAYMLVV